MSGLRNWDPYRRGEKALPCWRIKGVTSGLPFWVQHFSAWIIIFHLVNFRIGTIYAHLPDIEIEAQKFTWLIQDHIAGQKQNLSLKALRLPRNSAGGYVFGKYCRRYPDLRFQGLCTHHVITLFCKIILLVISMFLNEQFYMHCSFYPHGKLVMVGWVKIFIPIL